MSVENGLDKPNEFQEERYVIRFHPDHPLQKIHLRGCRFE
jgi:hypothetical protein